ncbi:hypothetical protein SLEP1_g16187 [Rubroshorea leprosula]|uniref:Uncharacterized protein n=1 Tax=Rubroshorea leprosula TaxID=152421 RepID=A0AAV5J0H9_9ROSI|nr:hypothetical protein SLEP1_g16187 [Rubroshorea leprosula]
MASTDRLATATATAIAGYLPLITLIMLIAEARELRPSNHGLEYQVPPPTGQKSPPEMMSFFGNTSSSTPFNMAQPRAMNSSDSSWWESGSGNGSGGGIGRGGDRLRHVLLVASLVCGGTGAALLVASAFIHLYRYQKRRSSSSNHDNNANNSIVIRK